jgi:hypothetical protein
VDTTADLTDFLVVQQKQAAGPIALRRAVANLLRLADGALRDADRLLRSGSLRSAAALEQNATTWMISAVLASECGWPVPLNSGGLDRLPDDNPLRSGLQILEASVHERHTRVLADGQTTLAPDASELFEAFSHMASILAELVRHFEVELKTDAPAVTTAPMRVEVEPPAEPPPPAKPVRRSKQDRPLPTKVTSAARRPLVVERKTPPEKAVQRPVVPSPLIQPSLHSPAASSVAFWSLMDRWDVADLEALALIGHQGGLTKKQTRPRFKLAGDEAMMFAACLEIDAALTSLKLEPPAWLKRPMDDAPFDGVTPLRLMTESRIGGARKVSRYLSQQSMRRSLAESR